MSRTRPEDGSRFTWSCVRLVMGGFRLLDGLGGRRRMAGGDPGGVVNVICVPPAATVKWSPSVADISAFDIEGSAMAEMLRQERGDALDLGGGLSPAGRPDLPMAAPGGRRASMAVVASGSGSGGDLAGVISPAYDGHGQRGWVARRGGGHSGRARSRARPRQEGEASEGQGQE